MLKDCVKYGQMSSHTEFHYSKYVTVSAEKVHLSGGMKPRYELSKLIGKFWFFGGKYTNKVLFYIRKQLNSYFELI